MSYKTIVVHVDESPQSHQRVVLAARLAHSQQAHLVGVAISGVTQLLWQNSALEYSDPRLVTYFEGMRERATRELESFEPLARSLGVASCESLMTDDESSGGFSGRIRCSDLVVIGQTDPKHPTSSVSKNFTEYVLLNSGRPALIVPYAGEFEQVGQRILLAWDGGMEAARAVSGAMPLLKRAGMVEIVVVNAPASSDPAAEIPGAQLARHLQRHGVNAEISQQRSKANTGNTLLALAADLSADMIVMGAYGHSRLRELIMGGATRTVLESMTLPVLMAH